MANHANYSSSLLRLLLLTLIVAGIELAVDEKSSVQILDELDDVVDDEEDEAWKEWGKRSIQAEMLKRHSGPAFGFVKLRLGVRRSPDMVVEIAMKWTKLKEFILNEPKHGDPPLEEVVEMLHKEKNKEKSDSPRC
ncbi:hypothetical protein AAG906_011279 [Vitis piasezkii]